eukprot:GHVP01049143.1.p1 GENE.GHVP01049143.1~~GHVP01049143.1.p1  ORF type:complete len:264 (+),score=26.38 GHVP01049143.1:308-1099(+)
MPEISELGASIVGTFMTAVNGVPSTLLSEDPEVLCCYIQDELCAKSSTCQKDLYFRKSLVALFAKSQYVNEDASYRIIERHVTHMTPKDFAREMEKKLADYFSFDVEKKNDDLSFSIAVTKALKNYKVSKSPCWFRYLIPGENIYKTYTVYMHGYVKTEITADPHCPQVITMTLDEIEGKGSIFFIFREQNISNSDWVNKIICTTFKLADHENCSSMIRKHLPLLLKSDSDPYEIFLKFNHLTEESDDLDTGCTLYGIFCNPE